MNWMLKGARLTTGRAGCSIRTRVNAATSAYRESQDVIGRFLKDQCVVTGGAEVKANEVYTAYKAWADSNREYVLKERQFSEAIKKRPGIAVKRKNDGNWYLGCGLLRSCAPDVGPDLEDAL